MIAPKSEVRDGMRIHWDLPIEMRDGSVLRADVFMPDSEGKYPVLISHGPYGKGLAFERGFRSAWLRLTERFPEAIANSTNKYQSWELVDPEKWVSNGYVCVRVDSRGSGRSDGYLEVWSPQEVEDFYDCIEWAGTQAWSNGKVGTTGVSYYAMMGWLVAPLRPPHLAAVCAWEGSCDYYRELARHGGILSDFLENWYARQVQSVQFGVGKQGPVSDVTGDFVAGPPTLSDEEREARRANVGAAALQHQLLDDYYRERLPALESIEVPILSAANWGGHGLHTRGNFEGFLRAGSDDKWLEVHGDTHFTHFYTDYGVDLQRRFFEYFLKGDNNDWRTQPKVQLNIRLPDETFVVRGEKEWPLARTDWTPYYLSPNDFSLVDRPLDVTASLGYDPLGEGLTFVTEPMETEVEITGPVAAKLWVSSATSDTDLFLILRVFDPSGDEVVFVGANDPRAPVAQGWLRASHRKLDTEKSLPYRPYHIHDEALPLVPNEPVEVDVEIWPTCVVVPPAYRVALTIQGSDYEYDGRDAALPYAPYPMRGVGPFTHTNPVDRPRQVFGGITTIHFGNGMTPHVLLPIIPQTL